MSAVTVAFELPKGGTGTITAQEKVFSTGSDGFFGSGKLVDTNGTRYQVSLNIVRIGSKQENRQARE